ncbi:hypothetical protein D3C72_245310 [compost metagenome]
MKPEGMKKKFGMFKWEDARKYLAEEEFEALNDVLRMIRHGRERDGLTNDHTHLIINTDEPYAPEVIEILKRHGHWG